jgi:mono/diheme cytochrome c family protein
MRYGRLFAAILACGLAAAVYAGLWRRGDATRPSDPVTGPATPPSAVKHLPAQVTFSEHVAPIIYQSCSKCHRNGEAGPFPLLSYQDVSSRAELVRYVTRTRYMPPWPADPAFRHFAGENVLTDEQIALIGRWVDQGSPEGNPANLPKRPVFPKGSQLGTPDLVVRMPGRYRIRGDDTDKFVSMKLPFSIPRDTFVRTIEFVPGNRKLVHHVNAHLVTYPTKRPQRLLQGPWFSEAGEHNMNALDELGLGDTAATGASMTLSVSNYLPGTVPTLYPEGIGGFRMSREGYLLMHHIHYGPTQVEQEDSSYFNVFFDDRPPIRPTYTLLLGTLGRAPVVPPLVIPPNTIKTFRTRFTLPVDISVLSVNPHMHLLGKTFLAYAALPSGDTIPLIRIPRWDFRWQYVYTFEKILKLPSGTTVFAEATFDNTTANPNNPFSPPREVKEQGASMRSTDEMFQCIITMMPYQKGDENISLGGGGIR